ncbi:MAG: MFS transporter [Burkholderiales bacterium]
MPPTKSRFKLLAPHSGKAAMPFIMLAALIDMISIGIVIPVLPALVGSFTESTTMQALWYGVVAFAFGFANFFGSPLLGALSDSYGRRPVLLIGFCGLTLSYFAMGLATSLWMLIVIRAVGGAMQANVSVANAYVADITPAGERAARFGKLAAMSGIGFALGPVLGGVLGAVNMQMPFYVAGGLAAVNLLYGFFVLPESLAPAKRREFALKAASPLHSFRKLAQLRGVGRLVTVLACAMLAHYMLYTCWVLYTTFKFGWGPYENGWALAAMGIVTAVVQGLLLDRILKIVNPRRVAVLGLVSSMLAFFAWGAAWEGWMMFAIIFINLLGVTVAPAIQSIISGTVDAKNQGTTLGAIGGVNSLMAVIAPLIGTPLLALVSHLDMDDWRVGAPFYFCAVLLAAALTLALWQFRGEGRKRRASK